MKFLLGREKWGIYRLLSRGVLLAFPFVRHALRVVHEVLWVWAFCRKVGASL
jgi:hypothetical protein